MTIKDIVKDNFVEFTRYRAGNLYYKVKVEGITYEFPVPISDTGEATFPAQDKAILFMRYINIARKEKTFQEISRDYEYDVKCTDCGRMFKAKSQSPISQERLLQGGLCIKCEDDYK